MNQFRHYFLYAKGHYKHTDVFADLQTIQRQYVGCDPICHIGKRDIIRVTTRAIQPILLKRYKDPLEQYQELVFEKSLVNKGFIVESERSLCDSIILANLSFMVDCTVTEIEGSLGDPDFSILPKGDW